MCERDESTPDRSLLDEIQERLEGRSQQVKSGRVVPRADGGGGTGVHEFASGSLHMGSKFFEGTWVTHSCTHAP